MILVIQKSATIKTTISQCTCRHVRLQIESVFLFQVILILRVTIMTRWISVEDIIEKSSESSFFYRSNTDK